MTGKFTRVFYATDVHGSEACFRKFLNAPKFYRADVLVLGGDVTGKLIVPIIKQPNGSHRCNFAGQDIECKNQEELTIVERKIRDSGYYPYTTTPDEMQELQNDKDKLDRLFREIMRKNLLRWVGMAEEKLMDTNIICYITGGNDDHQEIIDAIQDTPHVKNPDNKVVLIDETHEMASLGWANPTPWKCPRDCATEEELGQRVEKLASNIQNPENCVFNFHVPPKDCGLDEAPMLDTSVYPPKPIMKSGQPLLVGVGSSSIRSAVERLQPLVVLSGHIHEGRGVTKIGKTTILNPGSEYPEGILRGAIVNLADKKLLSYQLTSG